MSSESDEVVEKKAAEAEGGEAKEEAEKAEPKADEAAAADQAEPKAEEPEAKAEEPEAKGEEPAEEEDDEPAEPPPAAEEPAPIAAGSEHEHSEEEAAEEDHPHNGVIGVTIITTLAAVAFSVVGVREIYRSTFDAELETKVSSVAPFPDLAETRAEEKGKLGRYQWVSKKEGVVRVPLDRAVQLTVAEYKERAAKAAQPKPEVTAAPTAPEAPKPDGSAQPEAPKPPQPEAPKQPEHP
jgi:hypothetical protein